jgi:glycerol uptake facilitator-like aquaporin
VVGIAVAALIFVGGLTSGGSFNPARQFGPLLLSEQWWNMWPYLLGPLAGAVMLTAVIRRTGLAVPIACTLCGEPPRDPGVPVA